MQREWSPCMCTTLLCYVLTMHSQCTHMFYLSTISRWRKMDLRPGEVPGWMQVGLPGAAPDAVGDAAHRRPLLSHRTRGL